MEFAVIEAQVIIPINDPSRIAEVRRAATSLALKEGLDEETVSNAGIIATELATNLSKHASRGEIHVQPLTTRGFAGVELLAVDRGPGMANLQQSFTDGYSTSGTAGTGLGAIRRLSTELDVYSLPGKGTVISAIIRSGAAGPRAQQMKLGIAARPVHGETASGDAWAWKPHGSSVLLMVADGLGHGILAADASTEAVVSFHKSAGVNPAEILSDVHRALRGTRGAAVSIAEVNFSSGKVIFAGLGNVAGILVRPSEQMGPRLQMMVSQNGTAGHEARQFREFEYPIGSDDILVMHSDGLSSHWNLQETPGLWRRQPSVIAGALYRDYARDRDDVCVLVGKKQ